MSNRNPMFRHQKTTAGAIIAFMLSTAIFVRELFEYKNRALMEAWTGTRLVDVGFVFASCVFSISMLLFEARLNKWANTRIRLIALIIVAGILIIPFIVTSCLAFAVA